MDFTHQTAATGPMMKVRGKPVDALGRLLLVTSLFWLSLAVSAYPGPPNCGLSCLPLRFERISLEQGLSQSIVWSIVQDRLGFLWCATEDGLNRYDGYKFQVLRPTPGRPGGLSNPSIVSLRTDRQGFLWIGTLNGGLNRYDPLTGKFTVFRNDPKDPFSISHDLIRAMWEDRRGILWFGTAGGGLNRYDPATGRFKAFRSNPADPASLPGDNILTVRGDREGFIWVGTEGRGLSRFNPEDGRCLNFRHNPKDPNSLAHDAVLSILEDQAGRLWVGTRGGGLDLFDAQKRTFRHFQNDPADPLSLSDNQVNALFEDSAKRIWVGTNGGLNLFLPQKGASIRYQTNPLETGSLSRNEVQAIFEDAGGMLWVGTYGGGLNKCDPDRKRFYLFRAEAGNPESIGNEIVWAFYESPDGALWVGTHGGGLDRLDISTGKWAHFRSRPGDPTSLSDNRVRVICPSRSGFFWVGTDGGGVNRFDPQTGICTSYRNNPTDPGSLTSDQIRCLMEDRDGSLWIGTFGGGMDRLDPATGKIVHYRPDPNDPNSIGNTFIRCIMEDREGRLWIATHGGGLNLFDRATGKFKRFLSVPGRADTLSSNFIFSIFQSRNGILWLGTWGGGLNRFDPATGAVEVFTTAEGLPSNNIYGVIEDSAGNLWISSNNGLSRFDPIRRVFRNYSESDGLQSNEFNGGALHRGLSGRFYFGGIKGFNSFFPAQILRNTHRPPVAITRFLKLNHEVELNGPTPEARQVEVGPDDYYVSFEFSALDFASPAKNRYAYRMEGLDPDWIFVNADRRFATYTNLEPGTYRFRVKACNNDGVWNDEGAGLVVVVCPPFWRTWWFRSLVMMGILGALTLTWLEWSSRHKEKLRLRTIERELDVAANIQRSMLPTGYPAFPELKSLEVYAQMIPARHVGGDFYDYYLVRPDLLAFAVGDVSGKGVPAAMQMSMCRILLKGAATVGRTPADVARVVNETLLGELAAQGTFITVFLGYLDLTSGALQFVRAGHDAPIRVKPDGALEVLEEPGNVFLGVFSDIVFEQGESQLSPGDALVLYTDGITEASDPTGRFFQGEEDCLAQTLSALARQSAPDMVLGVLRAVDIFTAGCPPSDDRTILVIRYLGPSRTPLIT